jgi:phospholipid/cholesterol/gamma-HCH transport system permease protein
VNQARIEVIANKDERTRVLLAGRWTLAAMAPQVGKLSARLGEVDKGAAWDCREVEALDSAGAMLLWRAWRRSLPPQLLATADQQRAFERIAAADAHVKSAVAERRSFHWLQKTGEAAIAIGAHLADFVALIGQLVLDCGHLLRHPLDWPWREISANMYKSGVRAMPVAALVGFLIGVVLSYLSALQLRRLGAETLIVDILGMGIIRELGPVLIAVLVAGRSGSAMTAQLGVMRVTEEIDALATMGVPRSLRLVFPKVAALALAMPLLVLWITFMALLGGIVAADIQLEVGFDLFLDRLPKVVPVANLWIGLAKGVAFGILVALVACHFGLRVQPNTESLSAHTTASVVTSITVVILVDAVFAILTRGIGVPI